MNYQDFQSRFFSAVHDFVHYRPIKDDGAAYATVTAMMHHLSMGRKLPPKMIVHQIMLAGAYPYLKEDAALTAYRFCVPRLTRLRFTIKQHLKDLVNQPDQPTRMRSRD